MKYHKETKPHKYWKNENNFRNELYNFIQKLGHFPSAQDFGERNQHVFLRSCSLYHGGLKNIKKQFNEDLLKIILDKG